MAPRGAQALLQEMEEKWTTPIGADTGTEIVHQTDHNEVPRLGSFMGKPGHIGEVESRYFATLALDDLWTGT